VRIYLASRYSRRVELLTYAADLRAMGHAITSRWLQGAHQIDDDGLSAEADGALRQRFAVEDWQDLLSAECCISFTEEPRVANSRGGRHVEFGAALRDGQLCLVVGPRENVFHCLPGVVVFPTWPAALEWLAEREEVAA
jgi:hypothetical protein